MVGFDSLLSTSFVDMKILEVLVDDGDDDKYGNGIKFCGGVGFIVIDCGEKSVKAQQNIDELVIELHIIINMNSIALKQDLERIIFRM